MKITFEISPDAVDDIMLAQLKDTLACINQYIVDGQDPSSWEHRDLEDNIKFSSALKVVLEYYGDA